MRAFTILAITATLLATLAAANAATETPGGRTAGRTLDGWGPFKFGMTPEQARAVPGVSWRGPNGSRPGAGAKPANVPIMMSRPMTSEYGPDTGVFLAFNGEQKLMMIKLLLKDTEFATDCEKTFRTLLTRLDAKYGPFAPGGAKDEWTIMDMVIRGGMLERTSAVSLPGSRSRYWHRTVLPNVSGLNLEAEAKHSSGSRSVELMMYQKDGNDGGCVRDITFNASMPTKAQLEIQSKLKHVPTGMDWHWAQVDRPAGLSGGPAGAVFSSGRAENVKLGSGHFAADVTRPTGGAGEVHLVGTISDDNTISAHVAASVTVSDDFPASFEGYINMFTTDGEPVDTYEINLTGKTRSGTANLWMAAYHRNSPHTPAPEACRRIGESAFELRGRSPREMTYRGLLQALGCPPP